MLFRSLKNPRIAVLADDSGLCVEALGGNPGVFSARFAGESATDSQNRAKLLAVLKNKKNRNSKFICLLALVCGNKEILYFKGVCHGEIARKEIGNKGFGYDLVFIPNKNNPKKLTFAQMNSKEKNLRSHRALALQTLQDYCKKNNLFG